MTPEVRASLTAALEGYRDPSDDRDRWARFSGAYWRTMANQEARRAADPKAFAWEMLEAYSARVDCDTDLAGAAHAERLAFCQEAFVRLYERDGLPYVLEHPPRVRTALRFLDTELELNALIAALADHRRELTERAALEGMTA